MKSLPILLVPGFLDDAGRMQKMACYLQRAGLSATVVSLQPSDGSVGLEVLAWQLAKIIESEFPAQQSLVLVGFSMGGLVCRCYVQQMGGILRTKRLITLSTPHHGTYTSYLFNRPATLQMRPGSAFLAELNRDLSALKQIPFSSLWTATDLTILPAESSRLSVGEMVQIPTLIHRFVVDDQRVWAAVKERLREEIKYPVSPVS